MPHLIDTKEYDGITPMTDSSYTVFAQRLYDETIRHLDKVTTHQTEVLTDLATNPPTPGSDTEGTRTVTMISVYAIAICTQLYRMGVLSQTPEVEVTEDAKQQLLLYGGSDAFAHIKYSQFRGYQVVSLGGSNTV